MELAVENKYEFSYKTISEDNYEDIISRIDKVIKIFEISNIVSIDDAWITEKTTDLEQAILKILDGDFKNEVERIINNEDISDIDTLEEGLKNKHYSGKEMLVLEKFYKEYIVNQENTKDPTLKTLDKLITTLGKELDGVNVVRENKQLKSSDVYKYRDTNNLFILDRNMSKSSGDKDSILDSILELKKTNSSNLILIYSNECKDDFKNHQNKMQLLNNRNICDDEEQISIVYQLWGINKTTNYKELIEKFFENLYNCAFGKSLYNILEARHNALKDVFKSIKKDEIESYMPMFEGAYIEGDTILSGYSKIIDALYNKYMEKRYYDDVKESYKFLIDFEKNKIETSPNVKNSQLSQKRYNGYRLDHVKMQIRNILKNNEKHRIASYTCNRFYKDISLGDIIVYKEPNEAIKFGIIISRECDCVIRLDKVDKKPKRVLEEYTILILENQELTENLINEVSDKDYFNKYILPIVYRGKAYTLKPTQKIRHFKANILDLCSLNFSGQACVNYSQDFKEYKSVHSEAYYDEVFKNDIQKEIVNYNMYEDIAKEDMKEVLKDRLISYDYGVKFESGCFELERICRLETKRTLLIIQNYIHSISLVGVDTPIANEII